MPMKTLNNSADRLLKAVNNLPDFCQADRTNKKDLGVHSIGKNRIHAKAEDGVLKLNNPKKGAFQSIYVSRAKNLTRQEMRELLMELMPSNRDELFAREGESANEVARRIRNVKGEHFIANRALNYHEQGWSDRFTELRAELQNKFNVWLSETTSGIQFGQYSDEKDPRKFVQAIQAMLDFGICSSNIHKGTPGS